MNNLQSCSPITKYLVIVPNSLALDDILFRVLNLLETFFTRISHVVFHHVCCVFSTWLVVLGGLNVNNCVYR